MVHTSVIERAPRAGAREWAGLAVLALPCLLLSLDVSVLHLALPHLGADLGAGSVEQLWIMDIYGFMIAGFLVTMGSLGDRIGRRRLLLIGAVAFGAASVAAAYAPTPGLLIAARAVLGVAGATLMPSTLALISNMFTDPRQRGVAISVWMTCFMGGIAIGPPVAGVLLEHFWWGSVFLAGVPVMALLLVAGPLLLPEYRDPAADRLDLVSVALSLAAVLPVTYGLKELAKDGPHPVPLLATAVGAAFAAAFVRRQRGLAHPLMDLRLFANRAFGVALAITMLNVFAFGGVYLVMAQYLQLVEGLSPLGAGLLLVPPATATIVGCLATPFLARRIPAGRLVGGGLLVSAAGLLLILPLDAASGPTLALIGMTVGYLGLAPAAVLGADLVIGAAPPEKAGAASALSETSGEFGMALGIAVLGTLNTAIYRSGLTVPADVPPEAAAASRDTLVGALDAARGLPADVAARLLASGREAFVSGVHVVAVTSVVIIVLLAVLALTRLRSR
ncbi:MFS transporter [Spongiactinospora rosea]|uniref:MFS transporter n=1 Tax=Spongiactinospora rosea TaxID=2248750 RepID=A0A366LUV9_9ACTN|nr:MFS transporter [Spongiactinospora rosea]